MTVMLVKVRILCYLGRIEGNKALNSRRWLNKKCTFIKRGIKTATEQELILERDTCGRRSKHEDAVAVDVNSNVSGS